jgi:hypothetical protein
VEEARNLFREIEKLIEKKKSRGVKNIEMEIQYDYISAYLDFFSPLLPPSSSSSSSFTSSSSSQAPFIPPLTVARKV